MSWEAVTWANKQRLKKCYEQAVLLVLANCADPNGEAFVKWPGREHWWIYLSDRTRLPKSSLFRHLNTLVALGLGERTMQVLADGSRRPTFKLLMDASFDIDLPEDQEKYDAVFAKGSPENQSPRETEHDDGFEVDENDSDVNHLQATIAPDAAQSPRGTGFETSAIPSAETEPFPVLRLHKDSLKLSKDSPLPPSGGMSVPDQLFEEFVKSWGEPIPKMALARTSWDHVETAKHPEIVASAKGYWAWLKAHPKPPSAQSAQSFIRDTAGWEQWLRYVPDAAGVVVPMSAGYARDSVEGKAILAMYAVARTRPFESGNRIAYPGVITPQVLAFSDVDDPRKLWIEDTGQIAAWSRFISEHVLTARPPLVVSRGIGADQRSGIYAPWIYPPSVTGKTYTAETGPPLMTEEDLATEF